MSFSAGFYLFLIVLVSCSGPSFFAQNEENILVNASVTDLGDGAISATIEVSKSVSQKISLTNSDSSLNGASVIFAPGSLAISTNVVVEQSDDIYSSTFLSDLSLDSSGNISQSSSSLLIEPEVEVNPTGALSISIPLSSSLRLLEDEYYAVIYNAFDYSTKKFIAGVISSYDVQYINGSVFFNTKYFGAYQVVKSNVLISTAKKVDSDVGPTSQRESAKLPPVTLAKPLLDMSSSGDIELRLSSNDSSKLDRCRIFYDDDTYPPYKKSEDFNYATFTSFAPLVEDEHVLYVAIECIDTYGRTIKSGWSDGLEVGEELLLTIENVLNLMPVISQTMNLQVSVLLKESLFILQVTSQITPPVQIIHLR